MVDKELSKLWEGLNLTEVEEELVKVLDQDILVAAQREKNCLMVKVITERNFNKEAFRSTMP